MNCPECGAHQKNEFQLTYDQAFQRHEQCRQYFITAFRAAKQHLAAGQTKEAFYELLRANASIAQGLVYAQMFGGTDVGWLSRMADLDALRNEL